MAAKKKKNNARVEPVATDSIPATAPAEAPAPLLMDPLEAAIPQSTAAEANEVPSMPTEPPGEEPTPENTENTDSVRPEPGVPAEVIEAEVATQGSSVNEFLASEAILAEMPAIDADSPSSSIESIDVEPEAEEAELEIDEEVEEAEVNIHDAELSRLLATPIGLRGAVEALLFSAPEPLTLHRICRTVGVSDSKVVAAILTGLRNDYDTERRGFQIIETAHGYQMATREHFGDLILRLRNRKRRPTLSPAALETLAIIAYRQPIIRAEIEAIRGVESGGTIRNLIDMNLVEMVGRKEVLGRPPMYGTTEAFLISFGLRHLSDLPTIGDLKRRFLETEAKAETPPAPATPAEGETEPPAEPVAPEPAIDQESETTEATDAADEIADDVVEVDETAVNEADADEDIVEETLADEEEVIPAEVATLPEESEESARAEDEPADAPAPETAPEPEADAEITPADAPVDGNETTHATE